VPVVIAEVLVGIPSSLGFRQVIASGARGWWVCCDDGRALFKVELLFSRME
jgi:hypothetical protein